MDNLDALVERILRHAIGKFVFFRIYQLKLYGVPRLKWRQKIANEVVKIKLFRSDDFSRAWESFENEGLI